ncbi:hypothetical protein TW78_04490 [Vibrio coralliilyticus]|uniref:dUTPase-like domain-containing protein n=1 Tax=Vibrio coralliilyticus TaxID=190893 RepID=A0A837GAF5_9VIBR|nr:hypothetical protein [Vibrio coralliilyticus]KJY76688.1 hypothetical protein TW78_04490 [Vibrio coralliilyticus]QOU32922.1 hypothetical protein TW71_018995 [Vibrio coralliilyticus]
MQISTYDAVKNGFILDRDQKQLDPEPFKSNSSFDLTFREILYKDVEGDNVRREEQRILLKPQDSVYLISEQYIKVPKGHIAYVFLKNGMSQKGLLALNTGIIDQDYFGPISTLLINLSSQSTPIPVPNIKPNAAFFRVVFHKIDNTERGDNKMSPIDYDEYLTYRMSELDRLPRTFLNQHEIETRVKAQVEAEVKRFNTRRLTYLLTVLGLVLTFYPIARDNIVKYYYDIGSYIEISKKNKETNHNLEKELSLLKLELSLLKKSTCDTDKPEACPIPQPTITQNFNIKSTNQQHSEKVKQDLIDNLFLK